LRITDLIAAAGFNWYGFIIGAGMVLCIFLAYRVAKKRGYNEDLVFDIAIVCIPLAIVGARLYYVVFDILGGDGKGEWPIKRILGLDGEGLQGLAIYGGLIGAAIGGVILHFVKRNKPLDKRATFMQMADLAFTFIILGQSIGRWGNFANQEAYGPKVDFGFFPLTVYIDAEHNPIYGAGNYLATFFYESLWNLAGFALLYWLYTGKRKSFDGFILSCYCIYYGTGRMWIEGLRTDSLYLTGGLRVSQLVSGLIIAFGIGYITAHLYRARNAGKKPFIFVEQALLSEDYFEYEKSILHHPCPPTPSKSKKSLFDGDGSGENAEYSDDFYKTADGDFSEDDAEKFFAGEGDFIDETDGGDDESDNGNDGGGVEKNGDEKSEE
jgi:phosphatidylglycerol:prolipoprotein diacylglycerol transferase